MLNLSDKELDRFGQEAAQEYEPGDVLGPRSWDRLEVRMTQEFGPGWSLMRHIRRFPYYYAPALLVMLGVGYYLVRPGVSSGSSPGRTAKSPAQTTVQTQNPFSSDKNTSTPAASSATIDPQKAGVAPAGVDRDGKVESAGGSGANGNDGANRKDGTDRKDGINGAGTISTPGAPGAVSASNSRGAGLASGKASAGTDRTRVTRDARSTGNNSATVVPPLNAGHGQLSTMNGASGGELGAKNGMAGIKPERELGLSLVQRPRSLGKKGAISDSALRAFNAKSSPPLLIKKKGIYRIDRNWQFGLLMAPDFASVNSLAGDKAGSSIGLTVDYQFAPHWYLSSGILATRKNYAARNQDYHAPPNFYQQNGVWGVVDYVKGSFYMMEIPINLRYDFTVAGSTLFFVSAGTSSYLMTTENANLYWQHQNSPELCYSIDHLPIRTTNLFSTVNLSMGVETGISNSFSLLIAPYMKIPTKNLGMGQVQLNSVGINFALKWSPVTSRKRQ
jgi:hypothetical protein